LDYPAQGGKESRMTRPAYLLLLALPLAAATPQYGVEVIHTYPHDRTAFTQGFEYHDGKFYEGTGLKGQSTVRIDDVESGRVLDKVHLPPEFFGEGITVLKHRLVELTWLSHTGFTYSEANLRKTGQFQYLGEGWGLANDGHQIYFSDGTPFIRILAPNTLTEVRRIKVHEGARPIDMLNELEWIRGELWANVWQTDRIVRISPSDGEVLGWIDASRLLTPADIGHQPVDVLNGIAYDASHDRIFLTGKLWPKVFEVRVVLKTDH
jgi:glutamine cyclotransferase